MLLPPQMLLNQWLGLEYDLMLLALLWLNSIGGETSIVGAAYGV